MGKMFECTYVHIMICMYQSASKVFLQLQKVQKQIKTELNKANMHVMLY